MIFRQLNNHRYLTKLPQSAVCVRDSLGVELLALKNGKRKWTTANIGLRKGLPLLIYSKKNNWYWYRKLGLDHDINEYVKYIKEGLLYIVFDDALKATVSEEREREGMKYYDYIEIRRLILLEELIVKRNPPDLKTKVMAMQSKIRMIKEKYND